MALTLLQMCQTAVRENADFNVPTTIVSNDDPTAVRLLALANRTGRDLAKNYTWQRLLETHTFVTVALTGTYALPADFARFVNLTQWDRTNLRQVNGPVSPAHWEWLRSSQLANPGPFNKHFRVTANLFEIYPTPTAVETVAYQFMSKFWVCLTTPGTGDAELFEADDDTTLLDDDLMTLGIRWRYLAGIGSDFDVEKAEYDRFLGQAVAADGGKNAICFGEPQAVDNLPDTGFGQ